MVSGSGANRFATGNATTTINKSYGTPEDLIHETSTPVHRLVRLMRLFRTEARMNRS